jgi:hypothetical protein
VSDWLVKTEEQFYKVRYEPSHFSLVGRRNSICICCSYGGFSLGVYNPLSKVNVSKVIDRLRRLDLASNMNETRFNDYDNLTTTLTKRAMEEDLFDNIKVCSLLLI